MKRLWLHFAVYGFYMLAAVMISWPLVMQLSTHLAGWPYGDSHEMARHIWWYNHALRGGQPIFWQPALGYPDGMEGVLLWAHPQQFFPAWLLAFILPLPAAANLSILLYMALNGWAMFVLAQYLLKGRRGPALLAGLAFMAAPTFQGHLGGGHAGLMVAWPVPLYIYALLKMEAAFPSQTTRLPLSIHWRGQGVKWFGLAVLFFVLSPGGHILQLIYVLLPISATFALWELFRRDWAALLRLIAVNTFGCAILLIFVLPIARSTFETAAYTDSGGYVHYSADFLSVVSPSFFNPLYNKFIYPRFVLGTNLEEGVSYVGLVAGTLALIGALRRKAARGWLLLAGIAWMLSLGPLLKVFNTPLYLRSDGYSTAILLPWAALQNLPLFNLARTPGRFNFALALAVAILAGYGAAWIHDRLRNRRLRTGILIALMAALLVDFQVYWPFPTHSAAIPEAVYALAERDDIRAVLDLPWENPVAAKDALYLQTAHQKPLVAGHVTRGTPVSPAKLTLLQTTLDPALLAATGADVVILHKAYLADEQVELARTQLGEPFFEDAALALFDSPEPTEPAALTTQVNTQPTIERSADSYLYAPQTGWVDFSGTLSADGRVVELRRDQQVLQRWTVTGEQTFHVPIPVEAGAYHVIRLAVDPPCPVEQDPALECRAVTIDTLALGPLVAAAAAPVEFDHGVYLERGSVPASAAPGESLIVRLWWIFATARRDTDIRFIHVVDASGQVVVQADRTLGAQVAGSQWTEQVALPLPDELPAGDYRVFTGWYTYPDLTRFAILSEVEGAADGLALIGHVQVP